MRREVDRLRDEWHAVSGTGQPAKAERAYRAYRKEHDRVLAEEREEHP